LLNNNLNSLSSEVNNKIISNTTLIENIESQILELNKIINSQNKTLEIYKSELLNLRGKINEIEVGLIKSNNFELNNEEIVDDYKMLYEDALKLYKNQKYKETIDSLSALIEKNTSDILQDNIYYWIADSLYQIEKYNESITNAKLILDKFPDSNKIADAHVLLGSNYFKLNDFQKAEYHWKFVIENFGSSKISKKAIEKLKSLNIENN